MPSSIVFGISFNNFEENVRKLIEKVADARDAAEVAFSFIVTRLHGRLDEENSLDVSSLECQEWSSRVIGYSLYHYYERDILMENELDLPGLCRTRLTQDMQLSNFLGLKATIIECLEPSVHIDLDLQFVNTLKHLCYRPSAASRYQSLWLRFDICGRYSHELNNPWTTWNKIRYWTDHDPQIGVVLDLRHLVHHNTTSGLEFIVNRWIAESIKAIYIPVDIFFDSNQSGYPVLCENRQKIVGKLLNLQRVHVIFYRSHEYVNTSFKRSHDGALVRHKHADFDHNDAEYYKNCALYLQHLQNRVFEEAIGKMINQDSNYGYPNVDKSTAARKYFLSLEAFRDTLQTPLQPLMDNLEMETYETFERDLFKYTQYEEAVFRATETLKRLGRIEDSLKIAVLGAGRGPLVDACLRALRRLNELGRSCSKKIQIFVVEKNENAIKILRGRLGRDDYDYSQCTYQHHRQSRMADLWDPEVVTIINADMRDWQPTDRQKANILVSELLGSFGDNELSPECLDRAYRFVSEHTISIPQEYTSFVAPVANSVAWTQARDVLSGNGLHTPLVVKPHAYFQFSKAEGLFTFKHPRHIAEGDEVDIERNCRNRTVFFDNFGPDNEVIMHGFMGYFEAVLYADTDNKYGDDILLSTNPQTRSSLMTSWFPIFFPLEEPVTLRLRDGERLSAHFWRCVSEKKGAMWYEWCLGTPMPTKIQNVGGARYSVGLN